MFTQIYYANTIQDWIISISIVLGAFILNKIIVLINKNIIQKITAKTPSKLDDILFKMLEAPVLLGITLIAIWIAADRLTLDPDVHEFIRKAYRVLTVLNITWFFTRLFGELVEVYLKPKSEDPAHKHIDAHVISIIRRTLLFIIWAIGIVMALSNIGVDIRALLGTLGIGGLAFALAAQDTIKNIFGGLTILSDKPFRLGDRILVDGFDGIVEDIGIRSTRIRTLERKLVTIPNYRMVDASIENVSEEPMRRILSKIGLTYNTPPEKMKEAMAILKNTPKKVNEIDPDEVFVFFSEFADFSLVITFIYFI